MIEAYACDEVVVETSKMRREVITSVVFASTVLLHGPAASQVSLVIGAGTVSDRGATIQGAPNAGASPEGRLVMMRFDTADGGEGQGESFDRLFRDFPGEAIDVTITGAGPTNHNPSDITVSVMLNYASPWLRHLRGGLAALATKHRFFAPEDCYPGTQPPGGCSLIAGLLVKPTNPSAPAPVDHAAQDGSTDFCIRSKSRLDCVNLPAGNYGEDTLLDKHERAEPNGLTSNLPVFLAIRLADREGKLTGPKCLLRQLTGVPGNIFQPNAGLVFGRGGRVWLLDTRAKFGTFRVKTSEADFNSAKRIAIIPIFGGFRTQGKKVQPRYVPGSYNTFPVYDVTAKMQPDVCGQKLDDALRAQASKKFKDTTPPVDRRPSTRGSL